MSMGDAMRMTPLDIQQMVFKVAFRGYDKEEVNRFLEELAQTVESLNRDYAIQRERIVFLEQQLAELKRTEATLSSTLLSAQSLAEDVKRNAQREADLVIKEAEQKAGEMIHQARIELTDTQRDLTALQKQRLLMVERLRASLRMFERMLEVEEHEAFHDAATASAEKLEGESSPRLYLVRSDCFLPAQALSKLSSCSSTAPSFPTNDRSFSYGDESHHSGGTAIGR